MAAILLRVYLKTFAENAGNVKLSRSCSSHSIIQAVVAVVVVAVAGELEHWQGGGRGEGWEHGRWFLVLGLSPTHSTHSTPIHTERVGAGIG